MIRRQILAVSLLLILGLLSFFGCKAEPGNAGLGPVRVRLTSGASTCTINARGRIDIRDFSSRRGIFSGTLNNPATLKYSSKGIIVGDKLYKVEAIIIEPSKGAKLLVNGSTYHGAVSVHRIDDALSVVNYVDIENYVKGVMANEMVASWDEEALKAQAVVARTFAIYHILRYPDRYYNIESTKIQYKGKETEHPRTNKAVDDTKGEIVYFNNAILLPHFCSSCGGHTEYAGNVWQARFEFPKAVPCPYCISTNEVNWSKTLSKSFIEQKLKKAGFKVRGIKAILPNRKSVFGDRITHLTIRHRDKTRVIRINEFRLAVGSEIIKSGMMVIENQKEKILFRGKGWGHGVGMCQHGAKVMADLGYSYEAILRHYYPESQLKQVKY